MDKYIGRVLGGRYEVKELIGSGGMALVYRAHCNVLDRYVAIKILKDEFAQDEDFRKRFYNEAHAVAKLSHNNIVSVFDVARTEEGEEYIVMELCEGVSLKEYMTKKGRLSWQETLFFAQQVAKALDHAHSRGIIHQDIKPHNIMLLRDGTAKVMDFGIARFANNQETRVVQEAIGSVHYISPEQAKGGTVDFRTDIYSLGIVMYEMLTGSQPFQGETPVAVVMQHMMVTPPRPSEIVPGIPPAMDEIVMHAMTANVSRRYSSAIDLYNDLERLKTNPNLVLHYAADVKNANSVDLEETRPIGYHPDETRPIHYHSEEAESSQYTDGEETQILRPTSPQSQQQERGYEQQNYRPRQQEPPRREYEYEGGYQGNRNGRKNNILPKIIGGAVVVALVGIAAAFGPKLLSGNNTQDELITVENFIGMNYAEEILGNSEYEDLYNIVISDVLVESDQYEDGDVVAQDPDAGTTITKGSTVTLTLAGSAVEEYTMPDFTNETYEDTIATLIAAGITPEQIERVNEESSTVEEGHIIRTEPAANIVITSDDTIRLYVSASTTKNTTVPNLEGSTQEAAQTLLEGKNLKLGEVKQEESDKPAGTVIAQTVPSGTEVAEGTTVGITIAQAADTEPDNENPDEDNPDSGTVSGSVTIDSNGTIYVPLPDHSVSVSVTVGGSSLYSGTASGEHRPSLAIRTSYSSAQRVVVVVDGQTIYDQEYDFGA